jgi:hypothetical protein
MIFDRKSPISMCDSEELEGSFILTDGALAEWGALQELGVQVLNVKRVRT